VPDLTGLPLTQALSELAALRFLLGELTAEPTNNVRANRLVLRQSPSPGTELEPGARIDLVYATSPALKVPNVTSQSVKDATAILRRLGFTVQITYEDSDRVPAGNVLRQSPSAGEESTDDKPTVVLTVARPQLPEDSRRRHPSADLLQLLRRDATDAVPAARTLFLYPGAYRLEDSALRPDPLGSLHSRGPSAPLRFRLR
jgi:beta-lactam-binding protein with PASTA domain